MKQNKLFSFLININLTWFIILVIFSLLAVNLLVGNLLSDDGPQNCFVGKIKDWRIIAVLAITIGPLLETLLFQEIAISAIKTLIERPKYNFYISIFISSLSFSMIHTYSVSYVICTFIFGLIPGFAYYISIYRKQSAFFTIFLIHAIWNTIVFTIEKFSLNCHIAKIQLL